MAIAVDSTSANFGDTGTTVTSSHTCTGSDLVLIVIAGSTDGRTTPTCTYNGVSMTLAVTRDVTDEMSSSIFYLVGPATGTHDIVLTKQNNIEYGISGISFSGAGGVSATSSNSGDNASTTATDTVNTATSSNGFVVAGGSSNNAAIDLTYTGSGTEFNNFDGSNFTYVAAYTAFTSGSDVTESWTKSAAKWSLCGIEVYEPATTNGNFFLAF